jgi:hypothetical protein
MGKMFQNASSLKPLGQLKRRHFEFHIGIKNVHFVEDHSMNIHVQFGFNNICSFWEEGIWIFSHRTTNIIKAKLYMNVHWMVLYKMYVFYSDMKFKMAAMAGLSLTLDPLRKMFQNASSLKPLGQLKPNCHFVEDHSMNIHVQFGFNNICSFWEKGIWIFSHRVQC